MDGSEIKALEQHYKQIWEATWGKWATLDSLYWRTYPVWEKRFQASRPSLRPSTPANIVDHAVDNQLAYSPLVERPKVGRGAIHEERADELEPFLTAALDEAALLEPLLTWKQAGNHLLHYGYTVIFGPRLQMGNKPEEVERRKGEGEEEWEVRQRIYQNERLGWNPIRISAPHPRRVLLDPWEKQPTEAIVQLTRYARDLDGLITIKARKGLLAKIFPWGKSNNGNSFEEVQVSEYWDKERHILKVTSGDVFVDEENTWGFVPFAHAFSGWGREPTETGLLDPSYLAVGMLEHLQDDIKMQAQAFSAKHNLVIRQAFTPYGARNAPEFAAQLAREGVLEGEQADYWILAQPQITAALFKAGDELAQDIEAGSYARSLRGVQERGVTTVGQQAILSEAASKKFLAPQQQLEHLATITAGRILRLIDVLGEPLTIRGITAKPEQVEHNYSVRVRFELVDPMIQMAQQDRGMREVAMNLKSEETYRANDARIQDEIGERKRILKQKLRQHPAVQESLLAAIAKEEGLEQVLEDYKRRAQVPPGEAAPGSPPGSLAGSELRQPLTSSVAKPPLFNIANLAEQ